MTLTTYINKTLSPKTLNKLGFSKLIIEEPHFSILSTKYYNSSPNYKYIQSTFNTINKINPKIKTVFNLDTIPHNKNLKQIKTLTKILKNIQLKYIRLQDITIAPYILDIYPNINIELNTITGNYNYKAIKWLENNFNKSLKTIVLSKEITYNEIKNINALSNINTEILVQGPIQLLYTKRKLIENHPKLIKNIQTLKNNNAYSIFLEEKKRPLNYFKLINNHHGSILFLPEELCLIKQIKNIYKSGISSLLLDFRNNIPKQNVKTIANIYKTQINNIISKNNHAYNDIYYKEIGKYYQEKLTEGFFKENNTSPKTIPENNEENKLAYIKSIVKEKLIAIEVINPFSINDKLTINTPENKYLNYNIRKMTNTKGKNIKNAKEGNILLLNWQKGIIPNSIIYKK